MGKASTEPFWPHLRYATLKDLKDELGTAFLAWLFATGISVGVGFAWEHIMPTDAPEKGDWVNPLPRWAEVALIMAAVIWFMRGRTIHYRFPRISFGVWLGTVLSFTALYYVMAVAPFWASLPIFWGYMLIASMLDNLNAAGLANYDALKAAGHEREVDLETAD